MDGVGLVNRQLLARYVAPAAFLLAVTAIVLVVRSGLRSDSHSSTTTAVVTAKRSQPAGAPARAPVVKRYTIIASGDTLEAIAARYGTTVTALLRLNPGVEPTALHPGEQLRVR